MALAVCLGSVRSARADFIPPLDPAKLIVRYKLVAEGPEAIVSKAQFLGSYQFTNLLDHDPLVVAGLGVRAVDLQKVVMPMMDLAQGFVTSETFDANTAFDKLFICRLFSTGGSIRIDNVAIWRGLFRPEQLGKAEKAVHLATRAKSRQGKMTPQEMLMADRSLPSGAPPRLVDPMLEGTISILRRYGAGSAQIYETYLGSMASAPPEMLDIHWEQAERLVAQIPIVLKPELVAHPSEIAMSAPVPNKSPIERKPAPAVAAARDSRADARESKTLPSPLRGGGIAEAVERAERERSR